MADLVENLTHRHSLIERLENIAAEAPIDGFSLGEIRSRLNESAFGALLIVLAIPVCIPFLYGIPQIVSLPMMALAGQMAAGRKEPWLPERFANRKIDKKGLVRIATTARKWFGWLEALTQPRLMFLSTPVMQRVIGAVLCVFCASILVPLPLTNTVPGIAVTIVAFGLLGRDGLVIIPGLLLGAAWVSLLIAAPILGLAVLERFNPFASQDG
ncbi:MAG: exopolysaccharide biosynthesis protein [Pseudomonadota bacterium]